MKMVVLITLVIGSLMTVSAIAQSQGELDMACEEAREIKLKPLREEKINECKADKKNDPKWCDQFWADFGDGGRTGPRIRQRLFNDLAECVKAEKARRDVN